MERFLDYGYFSMPFTKLDGTKIGNTKIISLNSNVCYVMNFDSFIRYEDPGGMLQWFEDELAQIEKDGGQAIIL